ncbi:MAG: fructose-bisphosphate aldolase class I [Vulcanimicrobiaceae bacterium]
MSSQLASVAKAMVAPGKGILAADESTGTANKRFVPLNIAQTEDNRRKYRDLLFTMPDFGSYFSGVILYDETIHQNALSGASFVKTLEAVQSFPGIKLDTGVEHLALAPADEKITSGLDGLAKRVDEYVKIGAKFAKWRAVITIDEATGLPTDACLHANAHALARYGAICQQGGLVPIIEPEVLMDGAMSHTIMTSESVHRRTLRIVFDHLADQNVKFSEMILKPSYVIPGQKSAHKAPVRDVAERTLAVLLDTVPASVAGIAFLSGGQDNEDATAHLNEINVLGRAANAPWPLTFSYGRALQQPALNTWKGEDGNVAAAHAAIHHRAKMNSLASLGQWSAQREKEDALVASR